MNNPRRGFFLIHREDLAKFGTDGILIALWVYLNNEAQIAPTEFKHASQMISLRRGELLKSITKIADELNLDWRTVRKKLDWLIACAAIEVTKRYKTLQIFIKNYDEMQSTMQRRQPRATKSSSNGRKSHAEENAEHHAEDHAEDHADIRNKKTREPINQLKGERARAHAEEEVKSPPVDNLIYLSPHELDIQEKLKFCEDEILALKRTPNPPDEDIAEIEHWERMIEQLHSLKTNKKAPPARGKSLELVWYEYAKELVKTSDFGVGKYSDAIEEILRTTRYTQDDLTHMLKFVQSGADNLLTEMFVHPWQWKKPWQDHTLIDAVFSSMNAKKKKRI